MQQSSSIEERANPTHHSYRQNQINHKTLIVGYLTAVSVSALSIIEQKNGNASKE